uniref:Uncharacterized protein n=1 Tax=Tanacetum cinerariifolium TaxID=118510 RepID=A0A6L2LQS9_TANCI|nr:hypothetical protein [Tanacetum cinerariifolium]
MFKCNLPGSGISFLLAVGTNFTGSGKFFWQWELYSWQCLEIACWSGIALVPVDKILALLFPCSIVDATTTTISPPSPRLPSTLLSISPTLKPPCKGFDQDSVPKDRDKDSSSSFLSSVISFVLVYLRTMSSGGQGMNSMEIEQVIGHRVTNVIDAITTYETKTRVAHDSMDQVARCNSKSATTCYGYGEQGHYRDRCMRLKGQKHCNQKEKKGKACRETHASANNINA